MIREELRRREGRPELGRPPKRAISRLSRRLRGLLAVTVDGVANALDTGRGRTARALPQRLRKLALVLRSPVRIFSADRLAPAAGKRILIISHQLDRTGAPKIAFEIAAIAGAHHRVTVASAVDGPFRQELNAIGVDVIVAPGLLTWQAGMIAAQAAQYDVAICNTILTWRIAGKLAEALPTVLYVHEVSILANSVQDERRLPSVLRKLDVWCGSELAAEIIRSVQSPATVVPYGLVPLAETAPKEVASPLVIGIFASLVPRKGQDLARSAVTRLPAELRDLIRIDLYGESLGDAYSEHLLRDLPEGMNYRGLLEPDAYRDALLSCHAVLIPSRDDTLPVVSLDALGCARVLMCTPTTGTASYIENGRSGFVAERADEEAIGEMLASAIACRGEWPEIGERGREVFERNFSRSRFEQHVLGSIDRLAARTS